MTALPNKQQWTAQGYTGRGQPENRWKIIVQKKMYRLQIQLEKDTGRSRDREDWRQVLCGQCRTFQWKKL